MNTWRGWAKFIQNLGVIVLRTSILRNCVGLMSLLIICIDRLFILWLVIFKNTISIYLFISSLVIASLVPIILLRNWLRFFEHIRCRRRFLRLSILSKIIIFVIKDELSLFNRHIVHKIICIILKILITFNIKYSN